MGLFQRAVKHDAKLRLAIAGPSGSGKTYSALAIATALGGPVAFVDTEHGSASKYADIFAFDVAEMHAPYHPDKFIEAIRNAAEVGYKVIILDSMTHAWNGEGGLLELVEQATKRQKTPNSYTAWHDVTPIQNRLIEAIVSANIHIIATMRSKQEYVQEKDNNGRSTIRKVGMAPIQRDGFEYEFDVFFDMDTDNNAVVTKTRCPEMAGKVYSKPGAQVAKILKDWLGGAPAPEPKKQPVDENFYNASETSQTPQIERKDEKAQDNPFDNDAPQEAAKTLSKAQLIQLHELGEKVHGNQWDEERPKLVKLVSGFSVTSSKELTPNEADLLIAYLQLEAAGKQFYGSEWNEQSQKLTDSISKGRTQITLELPIQQMNRLADGIRKKAADVAKAQAQPVAESA